jgi:hypothetical protein
MTLHWFQTATEQHLPIVQAELAWLYHTDEGATQDLPRAHNLLEKGQQSPLPPERSGLAENEHLERTGLLTRLPVRLLGNVQKIDKEVNVNARQLVFFRRITLRSSFPDLPFNAV